MNDEKNFQKYGTSEVDGCLRTAMSNTVRKAQRRKIIEIL